jgi:DNA transformation protein
MADEREARVLDPDFIRDLFAPFGDVAVKRMFGGAGLYADGLMFGLVFDEVIYLRADAASRADFKREGSAPFVYPLAKTRGHASRHFWALPQRLYDDPEDLAAWAGRALAIAASRKRAPPQRTRRPPAATKTLAKKTLAKKTPGKSTPGNKTPRKRPPGRSR